jgi:hypothetical protein
MRGETGGPGGSILWQAERPPYNMGGYWGRVGAGGGSRALGVRFEEASVVLSSLRCGGSAGTPRRTFVCGGNFGGGKIEGVQDLGGEVLALVRRLPPRWAGYEPHH